MADKPFLSREPAPAPDARQELLSRERELLQRLADVRSQERLVSSNLAEIQSQGLGFQHKPNGAAAAAIISASFGIFAIGLLTTLAAANGGIKEWLNWYNPTGPLSGKTTLGVIAWLVAWTGVHWLLHKKETNLIRFMLVSSALLALGMLLMFPPIFELLE
jgi:hypothetical protein